MEPIEISVSPNIQPSSSFDGSSGSQSFSRSSSIGLSRSASRTTRAELQKSKPEDVYGIHFACIVCIDSLFSATDIAQMQHFHITRIDESSLASNSALGIGDIIIRLFGSQFFGDDLNFLKHNRCYHYARHVRRTCVT